MVKKKYIFLKLQTLKKKKGFRDVINTYISTNKSKPYTLCTSVLISAEGDFPSFSASRFFLLKYYMKTEKGIHTNTYGLNTFKNVIINHSSNNLTHAHTNIYSQYLFTKFI